MILRQGKTRKLFYNTSCTFNIIVNNLRVYIKANFNVVQQLRHTYSIIKIVESRFSLSRQFISVDNLKVAHFHDFFFIFFLSK